MHMTNTTVFGPCGITTNHDYHGCNRGQGNSKLPNLAVTLTATCYSKLTNHHNYEVMPIPPSTANITNTTVISPSGLTTTYYYRGCEGRQGNLKVPDLNNHDELKRLQKHSTHGSKYTLSHFVHPTAVIVTQGLPPHPGPPVPDTADQSLERQSQYIWPDDNNAEIIYLRHNRNDHNHTQNDEDGFSTDEDSTHTTHTENPPSLIPGSLPKGTKYNFDTCPNDYIIEVINTTALHNDNLDTIFRRQFHRTAITEHCIPTNKHHTVHSICHQNRHTSWLTSTDPFADKAAGGTGVIHRNKSPVIHIKPTTDALKAVESSGRGSMFWADIGHGVHIIVAVIYGKPNGNTSNEAKEVTNEIIGAIREELHELPASPTMIVGDLNADIPQIKEAEELIHEHRWTDVGAHASLWGEDDAVPTCLAHSAHSSTRRDYCLANPACFSLIRGFRVDTCDEFSVHQPLQIRINGKGAWQGGWHTEPKEKLYELFGKKVGEIHGDQPDNSLHQTRADQKAILQHLITKQFDKRTAELDHTRHTCNTTALWRMTSRCIEKGFAEYLEVDLTNRRNAHKFMGRGTVKIRAAKMDKPKGEDEPTTSHNATTAEGHHARRQARRLGQVAARIRTMIRQTGDKYHTNLEHNRTTLNRVLQRLRDNQTERDLANLIRAPTAAYDYTRWGAYKNAERYFEKLADSQQGKGKRETLATWRTQCQHKARGIARIAKTLKPAAARPLTAVARPTTGPYAGPKGAYATDPGTVDGIVREAWGEVYRGNFLNADTQTAAFMAKYDEYIHKADPFDIPPIRAEDLMAACTEARKSAPGLDNWSPGDFALLPLAAHTHMAHLLNLIEEGHPWPEQLAIAKASFLAKDPDKLEEPLSYRILLVLPALYRRWASTRLKDIEDWVEDWATPEMHAGVKGMGAQDGWYGTAVTAELAHVDHTHITGASADLHKCFDRIQRPLVYKIAAAAGMPPRILCAYKSFQEALTARNAVAGQMGEPYPKPTSIPQGCPLSMMLVALITRPWILLMRKLETVPRVLADDIMTYASGERHEQRLITAYQATHEYLADMGARLAPTKSCSFSTCKHTSNRLRHYTWPHISTTIPVANNFRDLGAHLRPTNAHNSTTLNDRLRKATTKVTRIRTFRLAGHTTAASIRIFCHSMALYGAEVAQPAEDCLAAYRTAIVDAITGDKGHRATDTALALLSNGRDLDREAEMLVRRVAALRRYIAQSPEHFVNAKYLIQQYARAGKPGTNTDPIHLQERHNNVATMAGKTGRGLYKGKYREHGPVGLLLTQLHMIGAAMDDNFIVHKHGEASIDIHMSQWQSLKHAKSEMYTRARTFATADTRRDNQGTIEIDRNLTLTATKQCNFAPDHTSTLKKLQTGAMWTRDYLKNTGEVLDDKCTACGLTHTAQHILWECPYHDHLRRQTDPALALLPHQALPEAIKIGIAPPMKGRWNDTYWGQDSCIYGATKHLVGAEENDSDRYRTMTAVNTLTADQTYRQACNDLRTATHKISAQDVPGPQWTDDSPPNEPNGFSDGSVLNPKIRDIAIGAAGLWHPQRSEIDEPLTDYEDTSLYNEFDHNGHDAHTVVVGTTVSSARAELVALISAIARPTAQHIALDNLSVFKRATKLLEIARNHLNTLQAKGLTRDQAIQQAKRARPLHKPWELVPDGDLWHIWWEHILMKNPAAVRLKKVKAHLGKADISEGRITLHEYTGNKAADHNARKGHNIRHNDGELFADYAGRRYEAYTKLIARIQHFIVTIYNAERDRIHTERTTQGLIGPEKPLLLIDKHYTGSWRNTGYRTGLAPKLNFSFDHNYDPTFVTGTLHAEEVNEYIENLDMVDASHQEHGITWLELAIAFEKGYRTICQTAEAKRLTTKPAHRKPRWHVHRVLQAFKQVTRRIIREGGNDCLKETFKPHPRAAQPFKQFAIKGGHATIRALPRLTKLGDMSQQEIVDDLLRMRNLNPLKCGRWLHLRAVKVHTKCIPKWRRSRLSKHNRPTTTRHQNHDNSTQPTGPTHSGTDHNTTANNKHTVGTDTYLPGEYKSNPVYITQMTEDEMFHKAIQKSLADILPPFCPHGRTIPVFCPDCRHTIDDRTVLQKAPTQAATGSQSNHNHDLRAQLRHYRRLEERTLTPPSPWDPPTEHELALDWEQRFGQHQPQEAKRRRLRQKTNTTGQIAPMLPPDQPLRITSTTTTKKATANTRVSKPHKRVKVNTNPRETTYSQLHGERPTKKTKHNNTPTTNTTNARDIIHAEVIAEGIKPEPTITPTIHRALAGWWRRMKKLQSESGATHNKGASAPQINTARTAPLRPPHPLPLPAPRNTTPRSTTTGTDPTRKTLPPKDQRKAPPPPQLPARAITHTTTRHHLTKSPKS